MSICEKQIQELLDRIQSLENQLSMFVDLPSIGDWIPKKYVMKLLDYGDTAMADLEKVVVTSRIGRRVFYSRKSLIALIEKNQLKKNS